MATFNKMTVLVLFVLSSWIMVPEMAIAQKSEWVAPDSAEKLENPLQASERIINAGNQIFQQLCAVCHGKNGKGDGITASTLQPKPANLHDNTIQSQSEGAIYWKIKEGRPPMPGFKSQLSDQQMWALVTFIKSLENN